MKDTHLLKIRHPDSEHNKKLIRDNNYGHGRIISESAVTVRNLKQQLIQAGYNIPQNKTDR